MKNIGEEEFFRSKRPVFAIYQLTADNIGKYGFKDLETLMKEGIKVEKANYRFVYAEFLSAKEASQKAEYTLEDIFSMFNCDHPDDYQGHSLSVSDVVVLRVLGRADTAYFCDRIGYQRIPDWNGKSKGSEETSKLKVLIPPHCIMKERYELRFYRKDLSYDQNPCYGFDCDSKGNLFMDDVEVWGPNYLEAISSDIYDLPKVERYFSSQYHPGYYECECGKRFKGVFLSDSCSYRCPACNKVYSGTILDEVEV